jgi:hypothetical protein
MFEFSIILVNSHLLHSVLLYENAIFTGMCFRSWGRSPTTKSHKQESPKSTLFNLLRWIILLKLLDLSSSPQEYWFVNCRLHTGTTNNLWSYSYERRIIKNAKDILQIQATRCQIMYSSDAKEKSWSSKYLLNISTRKWQIIIIRSVIRSLVGIRDN